VKPVPTLTEWACVTGCADPFLAPELAGVSVQGIVNGHPYLDDGRRIVTSQVVAIAGRRLTTASGSTYELVGPPRDEYLAWLEMHGREYDDAAPIKVKPTR
jgi:hypothetical protein